MEDGVLVPVFVGNAPSISYRNYFWDASEISSVRLDLVVGLNQITNATQYNYVTGNWYKNQYDDNFNSENVNTRFLYQSGYIISQSDTIREITGLVFAGINSTSGLKDIIVSKGDSLLVFRNLSGSISTSPFQFFEFKCYVQSSGRFTTDAVEDVAVLRNDSIFIFKGKGTDSKLDSIPAFKMSGATTNNIQIKLAQVSNWIEPYATVNSTTSDRDDIIMRKGSEILIFKNDNNNGISTIDTLSNLTTETEFSIGDVNNDGFNDILTCSITQGIKIFLNNGTKIDNTADYANSGESQSQSISFADFDKDGWNDMIVNTFDSIKIFLNNHSSTMFSQTSSYSIPVSDGGQLIELWSPKMSVADLNNKGGLSVLLSGFPAINFEEPPYSTEVMYRYNPDSLDAVPAPPLLFRDLVLVGQHYRPRLFLFSRGDRDFQKYIIYKKSPNFNNNNWYLLDSSNTSGEYIDYDEGLNTGGGEPSSTNCFYYAKAQDNSYQVSINSDTIDYLSIVCPGCGWEVEGRTPVNNISDSEIPKNYKITNYPNPFNPVTKIIFDIPNEGNVRITIFNTAGQKITELINEYKTAGSYQVDFSGSNLASGIYYYRIEAGSFSQVKKMILLK